MVLRKPVLEYYLRTTIRGMLWFLLIWTGIFIILVAGLGAINVGTVTADNTTFNGAEMAFLIAFFVSCMSDFTAELHFLYQHGVSRHSAFVSFVLHMLVCSAVYAAALYGSAALFAVVGNWLGVGVETFIFTAVYGVWLESMGVLSGIVLTFSFYWAMFLMVGVLGYFITILVYRLGKLGRILLGGGTIVALMVLPIIDTLIGARFWRFALWFGELFIGRGATPNPLNGIGVFAALAAIGLVPCWLLIRRVKLKK